VVALKPYQQCKAISNNERYFGNAKPYMQCVNSVCIVMQKISSPTANRQNLIAACRYSVCVPLVRESLVYVELVDIPARCCGKENIGFMEL
jgi:hypothetical protein